MKSFAFVTDSTSNLPPALAKEYNIPMIPLNVHWGEETYLENVTLDADTFYRWLTERKDFPKTSQPSAGQFIEFYRKVAEEYNTDTILSLHLSSDLSGTMASALQAKDQIADLRIEVIDSRSVSAGLGLQALAAARVSMGGGTVEEGIDAAQRVRENLNVLFVPATLEFLHRGGRIGGAARLLGSALNLKPVLQVADGVVDSLEKVRSRKKSLRRILELAEERANGKTIPEAIVLQAAAEDEVVQLRADFEARLHPQRCHTCTVTPVVGSHSGPGTVGFAFYTE